MDNDSNESNIEQPRQHHIFWTLALVMICCSVGSVCGRILSVESEYNRDSVPFFCANDRSRWCTVRALVDHGTYEIDEVIASRKSWNTIDKVRHIGKDGEFHYYSSKPPVLPTLAAAGYWVIKTTTGKSISENPFFVMRTLLILINGTSLLVTLLMLARVAKTLTRQLGPALFVVGCGCFGTYLTTFGTTFSNHVPAAACVMIVLGIFVPIWLRESHPQRNRSRLVQFFLMGLFGTLAVACDLPALSFLTAIFCFCVLRCWISTLAGFIPGALVVVASFFGTNYLAHGTWELAYAHRSDGEVIQSIEGNFSEALNSGQIPSEFQKALDEAGLGMRTQVAIGNWPTKHRNRWVMDFGEKSQLAIVETEENKFEIRKWKNWYDYPDSYWATNNANKSPVDRGVANQKTYLLHITVGHHGVLSLSPVFILGWVGMLFVAFTNRRSFGLPALAFLAITMVVFAFYINRPQHDRNFGGWTSCFRWAMWMYPLWFTTMVPLVELCWTRRWLRWLALITLFASAASASYSVGNPWMKPWIEEFFFKNVA